MTDRARARTAWANPRSVALYAGLVVLALLLVLLLRPPASGPPSAGSQGPGGTLALRRFLRGLGLKVQESRYPPPGRGTYVLFADIRTYPQDTGIVQWVERGGRLVITDPVSQLAVRLGAVLERSIGGLSDTTTIQADCAAVEAVASPAIEVSSADLFVSTADAAARSCFGANSGAFELVRSVGSGTVVVLGGHSPFTNALLDKAGNAAFAQQILGAAQPVVFGPSQIPGLAVAGGRQKGWWDALPGAAKAVIVELMLAVVAFAVVRGRRLGRPVVEEPISPIPAGELVQATGKLYRKARARAFAGDLLRTSTAAQLARRLGLPAGASPDQLTSMLTPLSGMSDERLGQVLSGPAPATDDELMELARQLEAVRESVEAPVHAGGMARRGGQPRAGASSDGPS